MPDTDKIKITKYYNYKYQANTRISKEGDAIHPKAIDIFIKIVGFGNTNSPWNNYHDAVLERLSDAIFEVEKIEKTIPRVL